MQIIVDHSCKDNSLCQSKENDGWAQHRADELKALHWLTCSLVLTKTLQPLAEDSHSTGSKKDSLKSLQASCTRQATVGKINVCQQHYKTDLPNARLQGSL